MGFFEQINSLRMPAHFSFRSSLILNAKVVCQELGLSTDTLRSAKMRRELYNFLNKSRTSTYGKHLQVLQRRVNRQEQIHYRSLACGDAAFQGNRREEVLQFLFELNDCGAGGAFQSTDIKQRLLEGRHSRLDKALALDKARRLAAKQE
jgi:hypothetical protein